MISHLRRRNWGTQWNSKSMHYLLSSGPDLAFKTFLSSNRHSGCLVVGMGGEAKIVDEFCDFVVGVNISREALKRARETKVHAVLADAQKLPFINSYFDLVVCKSSLHHLEDLNGSLLGIKRVMKTDGFLFFYEPGILNFTALLGRKIFPTNIHDPNEKPFVPYALKSALNQYFEILTDGYFFIFVHNIPILEKALRTKSDKHLLKAVTKLDALLCRTFLRNLSWIIVFIGKNSK